MTPEKRQHPQEVVNNHEATTATGPQLAPLALPQSGMQSGVDRFGSATGVRGVVLNLLARLPGRTLAPEIAKAGSRGLWARLNKMVDTAIYGSLLIGPAIAISIYQNFLRLMGKEPEDAFPDGTWQFYIEYALREDTARHAVESEGFDKTFAHYNIQLSQLDRFTAWVMAAIEMLHEYGDILENEWRERVYTAVLHELTRDQPDADYFAGLYRAWELQRPYSRHEARPEETYAAFRRAKFDQFLEEAIERIPADLRREWVARVRAEEAAHLAAYQKQMSILAFLKANEYGETRHHFPLKEAKIGVIYQGQYYLIAAADPKRGQPPLVQTVRRQVASILSQDTTDLPPVQLTALACLSRSSWRRLRHSLNPELLGSLKLLHTAPILINFDQRPRKLHLSRLRQAERGVGDHALTIFDTGETFVFDLSHIFFDGTWGAALAEIMTNEASSWATFLRLQPRIQPGSPIYDDEDDDALPLTIKEADWHVIEQQPRVMLEASGETEAINLPTMLLMRKFFKQRSDLLQLTVNDILVLYRAIHAVTYEPGPRILDVLNALAREEATRPAALAALEAISPQRRSNPHILIPLDASKRSPRDRLHPMTFTVPFEELNLAQLHERSLETLQRYHQGKGTFEAFDEVRRVYLGALADFGRLFSRAKEVAALGESASVGTIKLLAHLPKRAQLMLDRIPNRFEVLNDIIKGREVYSNIGAVVPGSTLTRFMTAKDDNENKTLVWAVMTDAHSMTRITLRDFRPHVTQLAAVGYEEVANRLTQDYLDAYARGLNTYVGSLLQITLANPQ